MRLLASFLACATASATAVTLKGRFLYVSVNDAGTLGDNDASPGIVYGEWRRARGGWGGALRRSAGRAQHARMIAVRRPLGWGVGRCGLVSARAERD